MKTRGKIIVGIGFVLIAFIAGTVFYQMNKTDEGNFASSNRTNTNQVTEKENDDYSDSNNSSKDQTEKDENQTTASAAEQTTEEVLPTSQHQENPTQERPVQSPAATETEVVEPAAPTESPSTGLHFSSRDEAIQFGFSRFTAEEIAIYNKVSENGLTPEQQEMAIQMAYSRFTAEEIAALEEVLGQ